MRRRVLVLVLALISSVFAGPVGRANPVVDVPDTPLSSPNVHLLATFPTGIGVGGRFMGRYFFETTGRPGGVVPGSASVGGIWAFDAVDPELPLLVGHLPLPHWENENVDVSPDRKFLMISQERTSVNSRCESNAATAGIDKEQCVLIPPRLTIVDVSDPANMRVRSSLELPSFAGTDSKGVKLRGPGHTATCILRCRYAYVSASRANQGIYVVDLRNLDAPRIAGQVWNSPAAHANNFYPEKGAIHDVDVDAQGYIWMTGSGGTALYAPVTEATVTKPRLLSYGRAIDDKYNMLIHHSSSRLSASMVMVNEESYSSNCGWHRNELDEALRDDEQEGSFQIWQISGRVLKPVSSWKSEVADYTHGGGIATTCSSHWFTMNRNKVVAIGWYDQGVRFLNVSNPRQIRQVGFWLSENGSASAAYFVPGRQDVVYVADYNRGLDVIRIDNAGRGASPIVAPIRASWLKSYRGVRFQPALEPDSDWGYACLRPA